MHNTVLAGSSALALALCLAACGSSEQPSVSASGGEEPIEQAQHSSDANVEPEDINPGWVADVDNIGGTSDLWSTTDEDGDALYFTNAANDAGVDVTFVDVASGSESNVWDLEVVDGHLLTQADAQDKRSVDITFQDDFTCYDATSDTVYTRGTAEDTEARFAGLTFVESVDDPDGYRFTFDDDGTFVRVSNDQVVEGTWQAKAVNVAMLHFVAKTSEWDDEVRVILDENGDVAELDEGAMSNLVVLKD